MTDGNETVFGINDRDFDRSGFLALKDFADYKNLMLRLEDGPARPLHKLIFTGPASAAAQRVAIHSAKLNQLFESQES